MSKYFHPPPRPLFVEKKRRASLPGLDGLRLIAAVAIYFFHVIQAHDAGLMKFPVLDSIPAPISRIIGSGYIATGLFFVLSGFLLSYVYLDDKGRLKGNDETILDWSIRASISSIFHFFASSRTSSLGHADDCEEAITRGGPWWDVDELDTCSSVDSEVCSLVERAGMGTLCHGNILPRISPSFSMVCGWYLAESLRE